MNPDEVKRIRAELGLTQRETADTLGVTRLSVSRWERGVSNPSPQMVQRLHRLHDGTLTPRAHAPPPTYTPQELRTIRRRHKLTQDQWADRLGAARRSVSRWECGTTTPHPHMLAQIAAYDNR